MLQEDGSVGSLNGKLWPTARGYSDRGCADRERTVDAGDGVGCKNDTTGKSYFSGKYLTKFAF